MLTGTAGIILAARQRGLIPSAHAVFDRLLRTDFRPFGGPDRRRAAMPARNER
ncbi:MAG: DUF3368 domain-containing protein [Gammaproteobacteria bacterium]